MFLALTDTATTGTAKVQVRGDTIEFTLDIRNADGILGVAGARIHCGEAGTNGPVVAFLAGAVPGGFDGKVKLEASLTGDNIVNFACGETIAELVASMRAGGTYVTCTASPIAEARCAVRSGRSGTRELADRTARLRPRRTSSPTPADSPYRDSRVASCCRSACKPRSALLRRSRAYAARWSTALALVGHHVLGW